MLIFLFRQLKLNRAFYKSLDPASSVAPGLNNGPLLSPAEAGRQISLGHFRRPTAPGLPRSGGRQFAAGGCESSPDHPMSLASDHIVESFKPM
jgi:hypothetical protein